MKIKAIKSRACIVGPLGLVLDADSISIKGFIYLFINQSVGWSIPLSVVCKNAQRFNCYLLIDPMWKK